MLEVRGLRSGYGRIEVLHGIDLDAGAGEIVTVIGANGAGKSTLLMTLCGHPRARAGRVHFEGEDITALPVRDLVRRGIAHVPEGRRIFPRMTVLENLQMGAFACEPASFKAALDSVLAYFPQLASRMQQRGGTLSGGEQQMLALLRALMSRPRLLLLDEPSLGLAPLIARQVFDIVRTVNREQGTSVVLVEQNTFQALRLAARGYVMVNGAIALSGTGSELLANPAVRSAYLEGGTARDL